ncbi:MAG: hypothetical protein KDD51_02305 [Bdellovibrionales bacterium]|nr:hypothetical protein [Bdellovibrionales bacterium]
MKVFSGTITALLGFTIYPVAGKPTAMHYEYQVVTQSGEMAFVLDDVHYLELGQPHQPGDYHFYRDACIGSKVRGAFSYWTERQLNVIHSIRFH